MDNELYDNVRGDSQVEETKVENTEFNSQPAACRQNIYSMEAPRHTAENGASERIQDESGPPKPNTESVQHNSSNNTIMVSLKSAVITVVLMTILAISIYCAVFISQLNRSMTVQEKLTNTLLSRPIGQRANPFVRLVNGGNSYSGRVEVNYNGEWGTVCDDSWGIDDARVICRMLGFPDAMSAPISARFGPGTGKVWLDEVHCTGSEASIWDCRKNAWGVENCSHREDASVICKP